MSSQPKKPPLVGVSTRMLASIKQRQDSSTASDEDESKWYFTPEELMKTRYYDINVERTYWRKAALLINKIGLSLCLAEVVKNTAIVFMHRFYMKRPFREFEWDTMAPACIFLASKVEQDPRALDQVLRAAHELCCGDSPFPAVDTEWYHEKAEEVVMNENLLLQTLGFDAAEIEAEALRLATDRGGFGEVRRLEKDGQLYALKKINIEKAKGKYSKQKLLKEGKIRIELHHKNVVKCFGTWEEDNNVCILTELYNSNLEKVLLSKTRGVDEDQCRTWMQQIGEGVKYLHNRGILHRNLKLKNILVAGDGTIKIADFGLADTELYGHNAVAGTPRYMPPEMGNGSYGPEADIWCLGVVMEEILKYVEGSISRACTRLLDQCLKEEPRRRPSASEFLDHDWFDDVRTEGDDGKKDGKRGKDRDSEDLPSSYSAGNSDSEAETCLPPAISILRRNLPRRHSPSGRRVSDPDRIGQGSGLGQGQANTNHPFTSPEAAGNEEGEPYRSEKYTGQCSSNEQHSLSGLAASHPLSAPLLLCKEKLLEKYPRATDREVTEIIKEPWANTPEQSKLHLQTRAEKDFSGMNSDGPPQFSRAPSFTTPRRPPFTDTLHRAPSNVLRRQCFPSTSRPSLKRG